MAVIAALSPAVVSADSAKQPDFWATWGDGKAELNGYTLVQPRYGRLRQGRAVLIFVTEDHSIREGVKIEGGSARVPEKSRFPVLKLNALREFQTGIYPYHIATSVFARLDRGLTPSKISASIQEWCGQVYHQLRVDRKRVEENLHSYFGGEGDRRAVHRFTDPTIFADALPILVRELQGPWLAPGETRDYSSAPALLTLRLAHKPFAWETIKITKSAKTRWMGSVLGKIGTTEWTIEFPNGVTQTYFVETAWPRRIIQWSGSDGESGVLTGSARLPYWDLNKEGDAKYLKALGWLAPKEN